MFGLRQLRYSILSVFLMGAIVFLASCSKKDVVEGDPMASAGGLDGGMGEGAPTPPPVTTGGAGDAGMASTDLATIYFAYDSYSLTGEARSALKSNADWLKANPSARVQIEGHCDERGTNEYNMALGDRRANSVRGYLEKMGVSRGNIDTISYGEERPSDPGHDEGAWSRNRRAVFVILSR